MRKGENLILLLPPQLEGKVACVLAHMLTLHLQKVGHIFFYLQA
jgi:hypothetical protein